MKHNYFKHLFTLLLLLCATIASAHDFEVNGIYYNILSETDKTVEVTRGANGYTGSVVIPQSVIYSGTAYCVTSIGDEAFYWCDGLTSITIPNSVTSIGDWAFLDCTGLNSITIPNSVTSIGDGAFWDCSRLTSITIPNSVTSIGESAFLNCEGLTSITIPNSVTSIGWGAFSGCKGLTSITIPNSVTFIGEDAFDGCTGLTSIIVDGNNTKYDSRENCNAIIETETNTLIAGCKNTIIPNSVTSIGVGAFYYCAGLTSVEIPNSVTSIGWGAFSNCKGLTSIIVDGNNTKYDSRENCNAIIETETNTLIAGCKNTIIPNSVTSIGSSAFLGCTGLTSIEIPNSVTSIGQDAFSYCTGLTSITIPNSVTFIGEMAFFDCTGLKSITSFIPADELFAINWDVFYNVNKTSCTLYVPYGAKETYAATAGWNEFTNIVEMEPVSQPGDINGDGEVNVGDFAALANIIINSESIDETIKSVSDINADGEVNVGDFAALVNLIFNSGSQASPQRAATRAAADETTFYIEPFKIAAGETKVIPVLMENPGEKFSQLQFDITLPEGLEIPEYYDEEQFDDVKVKDIKRGSRTKSVYSIQTQPVGEALRVLCITQNSKAYFTGESGDVLLITVKAADDIVLGDVEIKITNTVLSRQDGTTYKPADCTATVTVTDGTGIDDVKGENGEGKTIYDLQGRKVDTLNRGLYIIDNKKVVIK